MSLAMCFDMQAWVCHQTHTRKEKKWTTRNFSRTRVDDDLLLENQDNSRVEPRKQWATELPPPYDRGTTVQKAQQNYITNSSSSIQSTNMDHNVTKFWWCLIMLRNMLGYKINVHGSQYSTERVQKNLFCRLQLTLNTREESSNSTYFWSGVGSFAYNTFHVR